MEIKRLPININGIMWIFKNKIINNIQDFGIKKPVGFVYLIRNLESGEFYIGKKNLISRVNKKLGKKEIALLPITRGRTKTKKLVETESNWLEYWSSSKQLQEQVKQLGPEKFSREILELAFSSKQLTYLEMKHQIVNNCLQEKLSLNDNVLGRYFKKDFE